MATTQELDKKLSQLSTTVDEIAYDQARLLAENKALRAENAALKKQIGSGVSVMTQAQLDDLYAKAEATQVKAGDVAYPSCILQGDSSVGEFYSVAKAVETP